MKRNWQNWQEKNSFSYFFSPAGKSLGTPQLYCIPDTSLRKPQANFSLKHCHVFSHTAPPICAKNLSNYLSSGKPYLIIYSCLVLTDCSHCFLFLKQPADLSAKLCASHCSKFFPNHICLVWPSPPSPHPGTRTVSSPSWTCLLQHLARELQTLTGIPR